MAITFLAVLTVLIGVVLRSVTARSPVTYQHASFEQARTASEAGIAMVLDYVNAHPSTVTSSAWSGGLAWTSGTVAATGSSLSMVYGNAIGSGTYVLAANVTGSSSATGTTNINGASAMIYSGTSIVSASGTVAYVNLSVKAVYPTDSGNASSNPWLVIRSMGTAPLYGPKRVAVDKADNDLRRLSIQQIRSNLLKEIATYPSQSQLASLSPSIPVPPWWKQSPPQATVSRVIQVVIQPTVFSQFGYAMYTNNLMTWGNNGKFSTDSWNSNNISAYPSGVAIDDTNPKAPHHQGNIRTNSDLTSAITTNGGTVDGNVTTPTGATGIDSTRNVSGNSDGKIITSPKVTMPVPVAPDTTAWTYYSSTPATINVNGTKASPTKIHVSSGGALSFSGTGYVTLVIDGNWSIGNGSNARVIVPSGVHATVYVGGNIDFGNGSVNDPSNSANSGRPQDLLIYGTASTGGNAYSGNGNPVVSAGIYAPTYDVSMKGGGNGTFYGALTVNSYSNNGGGNLSLHYDEALASMGTPVPTGFVVKNTFEDSRL